MIDENRLPQGWETTTLKEITSSVKGKKPKILSQIKTNALVPYIDIKAFEKNEINQYADSTSSKLANKDDVLIVWDGARSGLVGIGQEGAIGSTILALKPILINSIYLFRFLQTQYDIINRNTRGTGIPHVDPEIFWNIQFPLPPLNEQRRIVSKLEKLLSKVEFCKDRLKKIPLILKRFRQSVLASACSGRLTADWREKHPDVEPAEELLHLIKSKRLEKVKSIRDKERIEQIYASIFEINDDLPDKWLPCNIDHIGNVCNGSTPSRKISDYWHGDIPWISSGEVYNNIITKTKENITVNGYNNSSVRMLPIGTVLLAMIGEGKTRGQSAILNIEATINQNIAAIILDHGFISPKYLWYWFQYQYEFTRNIGSGSGPKALNCQRVRELPFILPPLEEQQEIVRRIESLFKLADAIEARYEKTKTFIEKLSQSILSKAFRGELVPRDPSDEPASVLLERIMKERTGEMPKNNRKKTHILR